jgi:hypothetical protein
LSHLDHLRVSFRAALHISYLWSGP